MPSSTFRTQSLTDRDLARLVGTPESPGDEPIHAAETLFLRHGHRSLAFLAARLPAARVDAAQVAVWSRVLARVRRRGVGGSTSGLVHETALGHVNEAGRHEAGEVEAERRAALRQCLERLDDEQLELIRARMGAEGYDAIGERSTVSASRVHKLCHRATDELLKCFRRSHDRLHVLDLPEKPSHLAAWLEKHVAGTHLAEVVAELQAVHPADPAPTSMERALGALLSEVLSSGLSILGRDRLVWFLQHPHWLLELQERVLLAGGPYWSRVEEPLREESASALDRQWQAVRHLFLSDTGDEPDSSRPTDAGWLARLATRVDWPRLLPYAATVAVTALVVVVVSWSVGDSEPPATESSPPNRTPPAVAPNADWGWRREDLLQAPTDRDYLLALAAGADEWFRDEPTTRFGLARRLGEFRAGCSRILLDDHDLLGKEDRDWLKDRFRESADEFDQRLVALESGVALEEVRASVDSTVTNLVEALESRANHD